CGKFGMRQTCDSQSTPELALCRLEQAFEHQDARYDGLSGEVTRERGMLLRNADGRRIAVAHSVGSTRPDGRGARDSSSMRAGVIAQRRFTNCRKSKCGCCRKRARR